MDVEGLSGESSAAADILRRMTSSMPLLLQVASVYCAYSAATTRVVFVATSNRFSPCSHTCAQLERHHRENNGRYMCSQAECGLVGTSLFGACPCLLRLDIGISHSNGRSVHDLRTAYNAESNLGEC